MLILSIASIMLVEKSKIKPFNYHHTSIIRANKQQIYYCASFYNKRCYFYDIMDKNNTSTSH